MLWNTQFIIVRWITSKRNGESYAAAFPGEPWNDPNGGFYNQQLYFYN